VEVSEDASRQLNRSWYKSSGTMHAEQLFSLGTKGGRFCVPCNRWWQVWSMECPKCGLETVAPAAEEEVNDDGVRAE